MANKNRSEVSAAIQAQAAILDETAYKDGLDDDFAQSVVFRKDVATATTAAAATKTIDFLDVDYIEVTQSNNVTYTLNNVQQGEIKFLKITKTANQTIAFAVGTDVSIRKAFIIATTVVIYKITNKDGNLYIDSVNIDNGGASDTIKLNIGDWDMNVSAAGSASVSIAHGLTLTQIIGCRVAIRADSDSGTPNSLSLPWVDISARGLLSVSIDTTNVNLTLNTGGFYDNTTYDLTPFNRGHVLLDYEY